MEWWRAERRVRRRCVHVVKGGRSGWKVGLRQRRITDETRRGQVRGNCHSESYVTEGITKLIVWGENEAANGVAILYSYDPQREPHTKIAPNIVRHLGLNAADWGGERYEAMAVKISTRKVIRAFLIVTRERTSRPKYLKVTGDTDLKLILLWTIKVYETCRKIKHDEQCCQKVLIFEQSAWASHIDDSTKLFSRFVSG